VHVLEWEISLKGSAVGTIQQFFLLLTQFWVQIGFSIASQQSQQLLYWNFMMLYILVPSKIQNVYTGCTLLSENNMHLIHDATSAA